VVEYGYLDSSHSITAFGGDRSLNIKDEYPAATRTYNLTSIPQMGLNGTGKSLLCGSVVGGSSAINGMFFDRGSAEDYDAWVWAAGEAHRAEYEKEWGWKNILPWFRKSVTFHPPSEEMVQKYGITYDTEAAYGNGSTPIHSSYAPYLWPIQRR
jgi:choline dehydrogenase-like flavoprotein